MRLLNSVLILISLSTAVSAGAQAPAGTGSPSPERNPAEVPKSKVEELFIWKMSDELSLNSGEEKKFSEMVKDLNLRKTEYNQAMQSALEEMKTAKSDKDKSLTLTKYKRALQKYNELSEEELLKTQKLLGVSRTVQYLQVKQDLTNRLKSLLANPEAITKKTELPPPKVIEEK